MWLIVDRLAQGFEATVAPTTAALPAPEDPGNGAGGGVRGTAADTCVIRIEGMTCGSCVLSIEDGIGARASVRTIDVSLAEEKAVIEFDSSAVRQHSCSVGTGRGCVGVSAWA